MRFDFMNEAPNLRQIVASIHVDKVEVIAAGVVALVAGKSPVGDARIAGGLGSEAAEWFVAGGAVDFV
jgi:hypothetical protein